jgi:hypothetical protein
LHGKHPELGTGFMRFVIVISLLFLYVAATGWKYQVTPATDLQAFFHAQQSGWCRSNYD